MKFYSLPPKQKILPNIKKLIHVDAYRLENDSDLLKIGWAEIMGGHNLIIVEWPELVKGGIPKDAFFVELSHIDEKTRLASF